MRSILKLRSASLVAALSVVAFTGTALAQKAVSADDVAGKWSLSVTSPHGDVLMGLELKAEEGKLTGTLSSDHTGDLPVSGSVEDGTIQLRTTGDAQQISVTAKLQDGKLTGYVSTAMGDMNFTGTRKAAR